MGSRALAGSQKAVSGAGGSVMGSQRPASGRPGRRPSNA